MRLYLVLALLLAAATPALARPIGPAAAALDANREAMGARPATGGVVAEYGFTGSGLTGTATATYDLATGAYFEGVQSGEIVQGSGYDGATPWMRDLSGANTTQEGGDRILIAVNEAYRLANLWWRDDRGGAAITYVGREPDVGRTLEHLTVAPRGGRTFDAWFDAQSHLLVRIAEDQEFFHTRTLYSDYRREGGLMVAGTTTVDAGVGEAGLQHMTLRHLTVGPARPLAAYTRPTAPPTGGTIEGATGPVTVPFRLLNNHIYVQALVNGHGPYTFIVDTGGHTLVSPHVIREAHLTAVGAAVSSGAGEGTEISGFTHLDDIAVGPVHLRGQMGIATEIYDRSIEGIPVDGMVGFELFRRFAVTIDYGRQTLTFTDFDHFDPRGLGTAVPFRFYDHLPNVEGLIDDMPAHFDIDTGSRSELDITAPFVAGHGLHDRYTPGVTAVTGWGVGGPARSYMVRLPSVTLGSVRVATPTAGLSLAHGGAFSDTNYDGNIGSALLKRFVVSFDYSHQRMYLRPIDPPPVDAGRFDRSGMWINAFDDGYHITDVSPGGPAAAAGVAVGDVITAIDGAAVTPEGLSEARIALRSMPSGTRLPMTVRRGGETRTVTVTLRDQI